MALIHPNSQESLYRSLFCLLGICFLFLQYQLWCSGEGIQSFYDLKDRIARQEQLNQGLAQKNKLLAKEVASLYQGGEAFEYHARMKHDLIKSGEHYYRW